MVAIIVFLLFGYSYGQFPDSEYCSIPCETGRHTMCAYPYWDIELEGIAERWATQCNVSSNDDCRDVARFSVGQVMSKSSVLTHSLDYYDTLFNMLWFAEVDNLSRKHLTKYNNHRNIKHVAQILNANTMRIGCADVITRSHSLAAVRATICNYGPAILSGEELYKIGHPCANCPVGTKCRGPFSKYPHLCSEFRQFDIAEMKPNSVKVQMGYGIEDPPVFWTGGRKAPSTESIQGRYDINRKATERGSHFNTKKCRQPGYKGAGNVGQQDLQSKKEMYPKNLPLDDQSGYYSHERPENAGRYLEDDYEGSEGESQVDQVWLGGRELDSEEDIKNRTVNQKNTSSGEETPETAAPAFWNGTAEGSNGTTGSNRGLSPCFRPQHWQLTLLLQLSLTVERIV